VDPAADPAAAVSDSRRRLARGVAQSSDAGAQEGCSPTGRQRREHYALGSLADMHDAQPPRSAAASLLTNFSLEMTGKDLEQLQAARDVIPIGTYINVTFLANEDFEMRVAAAAGVRANGFTPVPHISARRLASEHALKQFLSALQAADASENLFVVAGDPAAPQGPYEDALAVIRSGLLEVHGGRRVSIAGYPEGHPGIDDALLWSALQLKAAELRDRGIAGDIITQFGFDIEPVLTWVQAVRALGIEMPIRIGVPGPAGIRRLLAYARRFGISVGASIAREYGLSLTNLVSTAGPERFIADLQDAYLADRHGELGVHFYTFGGLRATSEWVENFAGAR